MKKSYTTVFLTICALGLSGCGEGGNGRVKYDKTRDYGPSDAKPLSELVAGIWIDPHGCDHWIIDDGTEGYLSARLDRNGKPVCSGGDAGTASGGLKDDQTIADLF